MSAKNALASGAFFDHIPKTGGTACYEYFRACLGDTQVSPFVLFELVQDVLGKYTRCALISGHFEPLPGSLPADRFTFTLLRDPIERTLSEYSALLFDEVAYAGERFEAIRRVKSRPLIELLEDRDQRISVIFDSRQTHHFANYISPVTAESEPAEILANAKAALDSFDLVGVYADIEGFIDLACERMKIPIPDRLHRSNVTSRSIAFAALTNRERELLLQLNEADRELVEYATERYWNLRRRTMRRLIDSGGNEPTTAAAQVLKTPLTNGSSRGFGTFEIAAVEAIVRGTVSECQDVSVGELTTIQVVFDAHIDIEDLTIGIRITNGAGALLYGTNTFHQGLLIAVKSGSRYFVNFSFRMSLGMGDYNVGVTLHTGAAHTSRCFHWWDNATRFAVVGNIEEHFEGMASLCMTVQGGRKGSTGTFAFSPRPDAALFRSLVVHSPRLKAPSVAFAVPTAELTVTPEEVFSVKLAVTNTGDEVWPSGGTRPVCCSYHLNDRCGKAIVYDGLRTRLRDPVKPKEVIALDALVCAPREEGTYEIQFDLVQETVTWFGCAASNRVAVTVRQE